MIELPPAPNRSELPPGSPPSPEIQPPAKPIIPEAQPATVPSSPDNPASTVHYLEVKSADHPPKTELPPDKVEPQINDDLHEQRPLDDVPSPQEPPLKAPPTEVPQAGAFKLEPPPEKPLAEEKPQPEVREQGEIKDTREADLSLEAALVAGVVQSAESRGLSADQIAGLKAEAEVITIQLGALLRAHPEKQGQIKADTLHEVRVAGGRLGAAEKKFRRATSEINASSEDYQIAEGQVVDKEGQAVMYGMIDERMDANLQKCKEERDALKQGLTEKQADYSAAKEGRHGSLEAIEAHISRLSENIAALHEGKAEERLEVILQEAETAAQDNPEQTQELSDLRDAQEEERSMLEQHQRGRLGSFTDRVRNTLVALWRRDRIVKTIGLTALFGVTGFLIANYLAYKTQPHEAHRPPAPPPPAKTVQAPESAMPTEIPKPLPGTEFRAEPKADVKPAVTAAEAPSPKIEQAPPLAQEQPAAAEEAKFIGREQSYWLNLASKWGFPEDKVKALMENPKAKYVLSEILIPANQDTHQKDPGYVFPNGGTDPAVYSFAFWLHTNLSESGIQLGGLT